MGENRDYGGMVSMEDQVGDGGSDKEYGFLDSLRNGQLSLEMFELLPDVYLWVKNRDGEFEYATGAFLKLHGFDSNDEILGLTDLDLYTSAIASQFRVDDLEVMQAGVELKKKAVIVPNKRGGVDWREESKIPLYGVNNYVVGMACISRLIGFPEGVPGPSQLQNISAIVGYVYKCVRQDIKVVDLAAYADVSLSTLERMFKEYMGTTPKKFILQAKMLVVCEHLIKGNESIRSVGEIIGYDDHANFTRAFRKLMGMSPSQYRKAHAPSID
ncbi:MAG: helix-turn-helix domain-containing protein [Akkermansiaceae bacterium]